MSSFISPWPVFCLFAPLLLWKWIAPRKMEKSCPGKKTVFTIPQRHIYFILKGRFEVTLQSFPSDIFQLDILWHFQLNIADIPAEELKACLKGTPALKHSLARSLSPSLSSSLTPSFPLPPCLSITHTLFPSSSCSNAGLHALPTKCGRVASHFNPNGLPKSPRIYRRQTQSVWLETAYDAILSKNAKIEMR